MSTFLPLLTALFLLAFLLVAGWWFFTDRGGLHMGEDEWLFDFLETTGYSIQHLSTGGWAVTDAAHKVVGRPAMTPRDAVESALCSMVGDA